ncbi:MAG: argininosuccinate lyase [Candidatus Omnitrophica bacterium]|nr:argininosuccinate lyase [Candidatus Omnitrophota bacterium]
MAKKLWGSRFKKSTSKIADKFTSSIAFDKRLAVYDIEGSIAHVKMLAACKILTKAETKKIVSGLRSLLSQLQLGKFKFDFACEDIHSNIQNALKKKIGKVADKLHTARSRNDQVVLDIKMYCKDIIDDLVYELVLLEKQILKFAKENIDCILPFYTHLQPAQPVLLAHYLAAYLEMFERDKARLESAKESCDIMPLGSCALAGTGLAIDRFFVAKELGFSKVTKNSIDTVSDRDFILDLLSAVVILSIHFSRISEDLIIWSTKEFSFVDIDWSLCTGSSIMPHKKNPDCLELVRGSAGKIQSDLSAVLIMLKGLPLSYNRDMQLDKEPLFDAVERIDVILEIFKEIFKAMKVNTHKLREKLLDESLYCVDIMEYLISKGLSYRDAHDTVGRLVKNTLDKNKKISSLTLKELKKFSKLFDNKVYNLLNAEVSVNRKKTYGGTAKKNVVNALKDMEKRIALGK